MGVALAMSSGSSVMPSGAVNLYSVGVGVVGSAGSVDLAGSVVPGSALGLASGVVTGWAWAWSLIVPSGVRASVEFARTGVVVCGVVELGLVVNGVASGVVVVCAGASFICNVLNLGFSHHKDEIVRG